MGSERAHRLCSATMEECGCSAHEGRVNCSTLGRCKRFKCVGTFGAIACDSRGYGRFGNVRSTAQKSHHTQVIQFCEQNTVARNTHRVGL